eukprot:CAMPEP_0198226158 /NCGR_PEP_ID=MMETSP1445-20131203/104160_1 /TAXON_ID=36898 /ORGANISM="Pyramimonas sp., Strain CCMP2087" /LENGTH=191 /DNA_ID=CAMNT_0043905899 /DNA_START=111 /DNA_END=683 /DNA_ORIENTATION=+
MQWDGQAACCGVPACCLAGLDYGLDAGGARAPGRPAHAKYLLLSQGLQQRSLRRKRVRGVPGHALGAVVLVVLVGGVGVRAEAKGGGVLAEVLEGVDAHQPGGRHAPPREVLLCGEEAVAEDGQQDLGLGHHPVGDEIGLDVAAAHVPECQARGFEVAHEVLPPRRDERDVPLQWKFVLLMLRLHPVVLRP